MLIPSGMLRIFFAMLCVMIAALIGTRMTSASLDHLREQARKLMVTQQRHSRGKKEPAQRHRGVDREAGED